MLALVTKADNDYWYQIRVVNTIEDVFRIYNHVVLTKGNEYKTWTDEMFSDFWDGMKKEDYQKVRDCEISILIYNDYIE